MAQLASRQRSASCEKREAQPACRTVRGHQHGRLTRSHPHKGLKRRTGTVSVLVDATGTRATRGGYSVLVSNREGICGDDFECAGLML